MSAISPATVLPAACSTHRNLQSLGTDDRHFGRQDLRPFLGGNRGQLHRLRQQPVGHAGDCLLPAAGEVHLTRDGRLLSVQNFAMGNHEVDTRGLPYGIYDVEVEVIVNGRVVSKRTQRVNKLFSRGRGAGAPLAWQVWGGSFHMDRWSESGKKTRPAKESWLAGLSASGSLSTLSWAATGYGYDNRGCGGNPPDATAGRVDQR